MSATTHRFPALLLVVLSLAAPALLPAQAETDTGPKKAFFWFRIWPDYLVKYDVASDKVAAKVKLNHGISHGTWLSHDKTRILAITGQRTMVEEIDVRTAKVIREHSFKEDGYIIRVDSIREVPGNTHWYVRVNKIKNALDHYVIEKPQWLQYDLETEEVKKRMKELPKAIRSGARISPDGKKWHVFGEDLLVLDPETLKEEAKIEFSKPRYTGMGPIQIRRALDLHQGRNKEAYRLLYTMKDPVKTNRSLIGIVDVDLVTNQITSVKELGRDPGLRWGVQLTRDGKRAIVQGSTGRRNSEEDDPEIALVTWDLETGARIKKTRATVRAALRIAGMAPDGSKIYLAGRGHELVIFDGEHRYLKTIEMDGEVDGRFILTEE